MLKTAIRAGLIALALPGAASATTYDAYSSFNGTNPAGNFQYKSAGVLLTAPAGDCVSGLTGITCLQTAAGTDGADVEHADVPADSRSSDGHDGPHHE